MMNNSKSFYIILVLITLIISCVPQPDIRFLEPQPNNKRDLSMIPKEFQGLYLNISDSSLLTIDAYKIFQEWRGLSIISKNEMKEIFDTTYENNIEINFAKNFTFSIDIVNDSAIIKSYKIDTLFTLNEKTKLRKFKGYLFLNYPLPNSAWRVKTLSLNNNLLDFEELVSLTQIDSLQKITLVLTEIDTVTSKIKHLDLRPRRKELKEILKMKGSDSKFMKID